MLYGHVFRNAMLIVIAGFPAAFIGVLFTGSLLIEIIFSLDGLGLLGFEAAINRDYPVMFGTLYVFTLLGLLMTIVADLTTGLGRSADRLRGAGGLRWRPRSPPRQHRRPGLRLSPLGARRWPTSRPIAAATLVLALPGLFACRWWPS